MSISRVSMVMSVPRSLSSPKVPLTVVGLGIEIDQLLVVVDRQQRLDQEGVVAVVAVQPDVGDVVVDLEVVVVVAAVVAGAVEGGAMGDLLDDGDDLALDEHILGLQHRADVELVVAGLAEDVDLGRRVVGDELVVAGPAEDRDLLDRGVVDDLEVLAGRERRRVHLHQCVFVVELLPP